MQPPVPATRSRGASCLGLTPSAVLPAWDRACAARAQPELQRRRPQEVRAAFLRVVRSACDRHAVSGPDSTRLRCQILAAALRHRALLPRRGEAARGGWRGGSHSHHAGELRCLRARARCVRRFSRSILSRQDGHSMLHLAAYGGKTGSIALAEPLSREFEMREAVLTSVVCVAASQHRVPARENEAHLRRQLHLRQHRAGRPSLSGGSAANAEAGLPCTEAALPNAEAGLTFSAAGSSCSGEQVGPRRKHRAPHPRVVGRQSGAGLTRECEMRCPALRLSAVRAGWRTAAARPWGESR